jgi:hypothetical protein
VNITRHANQSVARSSALDDDDGRQLVLSLGPKKETGTRKREERRREEQGILLNVN